MLSLHKYLFDTYLLNTSSVEDSMIFNWKDMHLILNSLVISKGIYAKHVTEGLKRMNFKHYIYLDKKVIYQS